MKRECKHPHYHRGDKLLQMGKVANVIAFEDHYAMMRFKGCIPFVVRCSDIAKEFVPIEKTSKQLSNLLPE